MNCKPGDLAFYIGEDLSQHGRILRCIQVHPLSVLLQATCWVTDPQLPIEDDRLSLGVYDSALRPIRDPGEDARDETLSWKAVPLPVLDPSLLEVGK